MHALELGHLGKAAVLGQAQEDSEDLQGISSSHYCVMRNSLLHDSLFIARAATATLGPMKTRNYLTSSDAQEMVHACREEALRNKWTVSIAIVDEGGNLLHLERLDG